MQSNELNCIFERKINNNNKSYLYYFIIHFIQKGHSLHLYLF